MGKGRKAASFRLSMHCLRFFTVVGARQRPDLAVHKFVNAISTGKKVQLRGDLSSALDYTFADVSLAKKELGYEPQVSFEDAVRDFVETFRLRD